MSTIRNQKLTVSLNAYLGINVGYETWKQTSGNSEEEFWSLAPAMPVGISTSWLWGNKKQDNENEKRPSFTAFLSFLDLGGLLTYRSTDQISAETVFSFKNIFKPGLQFHYNIPKSPFFVGLGGQYGNHFLENDEGKEIALRATRFFLAAGVDVPIKTFHQRDELGKKKQQ